MYLETKILTEYLKYKKKTDVIVFTDVSCKKIISYIKKTHILLPVVVNTYILFYFLKIKLPFWSMIEKFIDNVIILMQNDNCV